MTCNLLYNFGIRDVMTSHTETSSLRPHADNNLQQRKKLISRILTIKHFAVFYRTIKTLEIQLKNVINLNIVEFVVSFIYQNLLKL